MILLDIIMESDSLNLIALHDNGYSNKSINEAYEESDFIMLCLPTNYDHRTNKLDTSIIEETIRRIDALLSKSKETANPLTVIKSTVPIGFTKSMCEKYPKCIITFSSEFLRETKSLFDILYPSRIIVSIENNSSIELDFMISEYIKLIKKICIEEDVETLIVGYDEAESIKLFSNTYLAMRELF